MAYRFLDSDSHWPSDKHMRRNWFYIISNLPPGGSFITNALCIGCERYSMSAFVISWGDVGVVDRELTLCNGKKLPLITLDYFQKNYFVTTMQADHGQTVLEHRYCKATLTCSFIVTVLFPVRSLHQIPRHACSCHIGESPGKAQMKTSQDPLGHSSGYIYVYYGKHELIS